MKLSFYTINLLILSLFINGFTYSQEKSRSIQEAKNEMKVIQSDLNDSLTTVHFDKNSDLSDYLKVAVANNPGLKSAFYSWKSDLEKTGYVGALPDPMFMYGYFIENVETRVGPQNQKLSIKQTIPWFGSLGNKKDIAFEMSNVSFKKYQAEFLQLVYQVKTAYYDLYYLGREIDITKENMELLKFWESVARTKYQVALKEHPDIIKAQVELGILEDKLISYEDQVPALQARFRSVLNVPASVDIPTPDSITVEEKSAHDDDYISKIKTNNPNLSAIQHMIEKEKHAVSLANKSSLPNFTFGVDYIETGEALNPSMDGSGKDPWIASVGINIPLWFGKNNAKKNEAKARQRSAEYLLEDKQNQLTAMAENIIFEHDDAVRKVQLYRDGLIPKAEQSLNVNYTSYQAGKTDFLNVLDAQRQLLNFQLMYDMSKTKLAKRKAELDMLAGIDLNSTK